MDDTFLLLSLVIVQKTYYTITGRYYCICPPDDVEIFLAETVGRRGKRYTVISPAFIGCVRMKCRYMTNESTGCHFCSPSVVRFI